MVAAASKDRPHLQGLYNRGPVQTFTTAVCRLSQEVMEIIGGSCYLYTHYSYKNDCITTPSQQDPKPWAVPTIIEASSGFFLLKLATCMCYQCQHPPGGVCD